MIGGIAGGVAIAIIVITVISLWIFCRAHRDKKLQSEEDPTGPAASLRDTNNDSSKQDDADAITEGESGETTSGELPKEIPGSNPGPNDAIAPGGRSSSDPETSGTGPKPASASTSGPRSGSGSGSGSGTGSGSGSAPAAGSRSEPGPGPDGGPSVKPGPGSGPVPGFGPGSRRDAASASAAPDGDLKMVRRTPQPPPAAATAAATAAVGVVAAVTEEMRPGEPGPGRDIYQDFLSWEIDPKDIVIQKRANGEDFLLGIGGYGNVRTYPIYLVGNVS